MNDGWHTPDGLPPTLKCKVLADDLDETRRRGSRTRLMRYEPGAFTTEPIVHDFWEEVYVVEGEMSGIGESGEPAGRYPQHTYTCRPPGIVHGPFQSAAGCMLLEIQYFVPDQAREREDG
jgi:hypothetical protein